VGALGGHSLLAVQLFAEIERLSGRALPLATLYQASTIERLADVLREGLAEQVPPTLVPIQTAGSRPPLFCVSRPNVNAIGYAFLSRHLGLDQPLYGLQGAPPSDAQAPLAYAARAAEYVAAMRAVCPHGPYLLTGYCQGALIAFEMTQQLEAQGQHVALLAILDAWPDFTWESAFARTVNRPLFLLAHYVRHIPSVWRMPRAEQRAVVRRKVAGVSRRVAQLVRRTAGGRGTADLRPAACPNPDRGGDRVRACASRIAVFRVGRQPFWRVNDRRLGWGAWTHGRVEVADVPGEHTTILREPHVRVLAARLQACIDAALASHSAEPHHTASSQIEAHSQ
jgi:thioesterase domain-containing protein